MLDSSRILPAQAATRTKTRRRRAKTLSTSRWIKCCCNPPHVNTWNMQVLRGIRCACTLLFLSLVSVTACARPSQPGDALSMENAVPSPTPPALSATSESLGQPDSNEPQAHVVRMAIIAHSVSTSMEARAILHRQGWMETSLRRADGILVVVRSMLLWPLQHHYPSIGELDRDAAGQLNISGEEFHVYLYLIGEDLSATELHHAHYPATDF